MTRIRLTACALAVALLLVPASTATAAPFSPKTLKGKWRGTWSNLTFGTSGPINATFATRNSGRRLKITLDFGGSVFGCQDPPAASITLPRGRANNRWHSGGFKLVGPSLAFGQRTITYSHRTRKVTGRGQDPPCAPGLTWTMSGRVSRTYKRLTATVNITLPNGQPAVSKLDVRKL